MFVKSKRSKRRNKMNYKRVFLIVLDSFGIGEMSDAEAYGDIGSDTLSSVYETGKLNVPNLKKLGLFNIKGVRADKPEKTPIGVYGRAEERSNGKDTIVGHWEIAGVVSDEPFPTYPNGFPSEILDELEARTGIGAICNMPYSGTEVISDYGKEHFETKKMIVYTSSDSVFQAAAHNDVYPLSVLYSYCEEARKILTGKHRVGRVIARPFTGEYPSFVRTSDRHDYSVEPPKPTMLDILKDNGYDVITVGKIYDIFSGRGITESYKTKSNNDGMIKTTELQSKDFTGICFINLVDFDMKFGHRNDAHGYAEALNRFDEWLGTFLNEMKENDLLIITADHGCDPKTESTDHSREYVPILCYSKGINSIDLGERDSFCDISKTILSNFEIKDDTDGNSFLSVLCKYDQQMLIEEADKARKYSFSPYSSYKVGAALLCDDGKIFCGTNIESVSYSPTVCAERNAVFKAVSEGKKNFIALAVAGGKGEISECTPCGVCRQVIYELCSKDLPIIYMGKDGKINVERIEALLPHGFSQSSLED